MSCIAYWYLYHVLLSWTHIFLFFFGGCRDIWQLSKSAFRYKKMDVHTKLMRKYNQVPEWWFLCILFLSIAATIFTCEYYNEQLQLPWWGVLLACGIALFFTLPVGVITATTNKVHLCVIFLINSFFCNDVKYVVDAEMPLHSAMFPLSSFSA